MAVYVTNLEKDEVRPEQMALLYAQRADTGNVFDELNLNSAIETAKYAKYAKAEGVVQRLPFTCRVKSFGPVYFCFDAFFSRGSHGSRLLQLRFPG